MKLIAILMIAASAGIASAVEPEPATIRELIAAYDVEYLSNFSVRAELSLPVAFLPEQGYGSASISISGSEPEMAVRILRNAPHLAFIEDSLNERGPRGTQIVSYDLAQYIFVELLEARITRFAEISEVDTPDTIVNRVAGRDVRQEVYPRNHDDLKNQVYRYLLPLGRGFGQCIDNVSSVSSNPDGTLAVRARGRLFSPYDGTWELTLDPADEYLVTSSSFTMDGHSGVDFRTSTSLTLMEGGVLGEAGWIDFDGYRIEVKGATYQSTPDAELISICRSMKDQPMRNRDLRIVDFTKVNSHGVPEIRILPKSSD